MSGAAAPVPLARAGAGRDDMPSAGAPQRRGIGRLIRSPIAWIVAWLVIRLIYNALRDLVPDEAYYWVWSRHPAAGYLDHPPMVAWLIRLSTSVLGTSEWSIRVPPALLTTLTLACVLWMLRRQSVTRPARRLAFVMLLVGPMVGALGTLATPDTPSICFDTLALACVLEALREGGGQGARQGLWWLGFGFFCGLGLLSKYTSVLLPAAVVLSLSLSAAGRRRLTSPWPWLALVIAVGVFSPVIWWNANHDWASFRFQLHHGFSAQGTAVTQAPSMTLAKRVVSLGTYIGGQAAVWTPVLFVIALIAIRRELRWLRQGDSAAPGERAIVGVLVCAALLPLIFFAVSAVSGSVELNWPAFAYVPITLITARWLDSDPLGPRGMLFGWVRLGCIVAACIALVAQVPELIWWAGPDHLQAKELFGWQRYAQIVQGLRGRAALACNDYQQASELSFYLPGRPEIFAMNIRSRASAYDYFPGRPDLATIDDLLFVGKAEDLMDRFPHVVRIEPAPNVFVYGKRVRGVHVVRAWR